MVGRDVTVNFEWSRYAKWNGNVSYDVFATDAKYLGIVVVFVWDLGYPPAFGGSALCGREFGFVVLPAKLDGVCVVPFEVRLEFVNWRLLGHHLGFYVLQVFFFLFVLYVKGPGE